MHEINTNAVPIRIYLYTEQTSDALAGNCYVLYKRLIAYKKPDAFVHQVLKLHCF
jgi:hypothetical protein